MHYFYCPNCGFSQEIDPKDMPRNRVWNCRDGYGRPICHYECPTCGNLDAGAMSMVDRENDPNWKSYCESVISLYQGVRGIKSGK